MKRIKYILLVSLFCVNNVSGQFASMQIINNLADNYTDAVDVYLNGSKLVSNLAFRNATDFTNAPANISFSLSVAVKNSTSVADTFYSSQLYFDSASRHVIVINGIASAFGYSPAPPVFFDIYDSVRDIATNTGNVDVLFHNGSTDAVPVNVYINNNEVANNLYYRDFSDYTSLVYTNYTVDVTDTSGSLIRTYSLPLQSTNTPGEVNTIITSGFMNPANNNNGPAFGLYIAKSAGGPLIALPVLSTYASNFLLNGENVTLYPNPATISVYLAGNIDFNNVSGEVYDISGNIAKRFNSFGSQQIDVSSLIEGIYFLRLEVKGQYIVQQFLKQ